MFCYSAGSAGLVWGCSPHIQLAPRWHLWYASTRTAFHVVILMDVTLHGTLLPTGTNETIRTMMRWAQHLFLCAYPGPWTSPLSPHPCSGHLGMALPLSFHCSEGKILTACHCLRREPRVTWHLLFTPILVPSLNTTLAFSWNIQVLRCGAGKMAQRLKGLVV